MLAACKMSLDSTAQPDAGSDVSAACQEATSHSDLAWIQSEIFVPQCAACHGASDHQGGLDLTGSDMRDQLVGVTSTTAPSWQRVVAGQPAQSYLLVAIGNVTGPQPPGGIMPQGGSQLCSQKQDAIARWISDGAQ